MIIAGNAVLSGLQHSVASSGAACHSHLSKYVLICLMVFHLFIPFYFRPSQILLDTGVPEDIARAAMRLSVGRKTSREDIDIFLSDLKQSLSKLH